MLQRVHSDVNLLCVCVCTYVSIGGICVSGALAACCQPISACSMQSWNGFSVFCVWAWPRLAPHRNLHLSSDWAALTAANSCVCIDFYLSGASKWLFLCTKWAGQSEGPHPFCECPLPEPESALWTHIHLKQPCFYSFGCNWPVLVSLPHGTGTKKVTECLRGKLIFLPPFTGLFVWLHMLNGAFFF